MLCRHQGHSLRKSESILGADGGSWTYWKRNDLWNTFAPTRAKTARIREIKPSLPVTPAPVRLGIDERHAAFTSLLENLSLVDEDAADLLRRGLTADQIHRMGAKTFRSGQRFSHLPMGLPGFGAGRFDGSTGYLVPTRDWDGRINGGQIKPRNGSGYRWLTGCHLPCGEMPLQVIPGDPSKPVYVVEGIGAKPWLVHFKSGATVIGIAGGCWDSPIQTSELRALTDGQEWILLPDGDSIYNNQVLNSYIAFSKLVPDLKVRWWDQFYKGQDADETDDWLNGTDIPSTEFFDGDRLSLLQSRGWMFHLDRKADITLDAQYLPSGLVANRNERLVAVISGLGTGKTESQKDIVKRAHADDRPVIALSTLRRLSQQQGRRIGLPYIEEGKTEDLDRESDRSFGIAYRKQVGFCSCTASLRPTSALKFNAADYKGAVVILDEIDTLLADLKTNQQTDIAKHRVDVETSLIELLQSAHQIFILSGTMKQIDIDYIEGRIGEHAFLIQNTHQPAAGRELTCFTKESLLRSQLHRCVSADKRALVHTSDQSDSAWAARRVVGALKEMCPELTDKNTEFLDGESSRTGNDVQKLLAKDPNAVLGRLNLAALSPAVNTGVDITVRGHFDGVFIYSRGHLGVADVIQVGGRLRDNTRRLLFTPTAVPASHFGGETDWRRIRDDVKQHAQKFASETQVSSLVGTVLPKDPGFIYSAKLYALRNMQAQNYRQLILDGYSRQGYAITTLDREPTAAEKQTNQKQKELVTIENDRDAIKIAAAPMPTPGQENIPAASRQKAETVRIFGIEPDDLTAHHIQQHSKALRALRNRFLYRDPATAAFHCTQRIEERAPGGDLSKVDPFDIYLLSERTERLRWIHDLLERADATDLFKRTDYFDQKDPMVQRIHRMVMEDPQAKKHIGSKFSSFKTPICVIQSILQIFGLKTESKMGSRSADRVRQYRIHDAFQEFNPASVIRRWRESPELLLGEPSDEGGGTEYL